MKNWKKIKFDHDNVSKKILIWKDDDKKFFFLKFPKNKKSSGRR